MSNNKAIEGKSVSLVALSDDVPCSKFNWINHIAHLTPNKGCCSPPLPAQIPPSTPDRHTNVTPAEAPTASVFDHPKGKVVRLSVWALLLEATPAASEPVQMPEVACILKGGPTFILTAVSGSS